MSLGGAGDANGAAESTRGAPVRLLTYALTVGALLSLGAALVALARTPLALVAGGDGPTAAAASRALLLLAPAALVVAFRRYLHGVLPRRGRTGPALYASLVRLVATSGVAVGGVLTVGGSVELGAVALVLGAVVEVLVLVASMRANMEVVRGMGACDSSAPSWGTLVTQHLPFTVNWLLNMAPQVVLLGLIARAVDGDAAIVAWPVVYGLVYNFAGAVGDLDSVECTAGGAGSLRFARIASVVIATLLVTVYLVVVLTPLRHVYLTDFSGLTGAAAEVADGAVWIGAAVPLGRTARAHLRGRVMVAGRISAMVAAAPLHLVCLAAVTIVQTTAGLPGVAAGLLAMGGAVLLEALILWPAARTGGGGKTPGVNGSRSPAR